MTLTHTPAHTSHYPDRFEDDVTGWGYSVRADTTAEDPRNWTKPEYPGLYAYNEPSVGRSVLRNHPDGNPAVDVFAEFYDRFCNDDRALQLTRRWLRIFHPDETWHCEIQTIRGYSQSDWLDVFCAVLDGHGSPEQFITQVRMWAFGDVWTVIPDRGAGMTGIYADDAEAALAYFREKFEDNSSLEPENQDAIDPFEVAGPFLVSWEIDSDEDISPAQAALHAWEKFGRGPHQPGPDTCCVFTVSDTATGRKVTIDLSDPKYASLFTSGGLVGTDHIPKLIADAIHADHTQIRDRKKD